MILGGKKKRLEIWLLCDSPLSQGFFQGFCDVAKVAIIKKFI